MAELLTLSEAIRRFIGDGDTAALEGFTHLIPTAAAHEIVRQAKKDLTLVRMTPDLVYDLLIGAGCAKKLIFSWGGNPGVFDVQSVEALHDTLMQLPLFPYMDIEVTGLCRHPSSIHADDR